MKNRIRKAAVVIGVLALSVVGLFGCGKASSSEAKGTEITTETASTEARVIRLGNFPFSIWNAQILVAHQNGYFDEVFADKNVTVEWTDFANGPAANEAFVAGDLDIINGIGDQPIIVGIGNGVDTVILSGAAKQGGNIGIIASPESGIKSVEELSGKKVGVYIGTYVHKSIIGILGDAGIKEEEVELVNITSVADATAAFESGDIDAYLSMNGNYIHEKLEEGYTKIIDCSLHPAYSYLVASKKFVDENTDILTDFFVAIDKAQKWIDENPDEAYKVIGEFADQDETSVRYTLEGATIQLAWDDQYQQNLFDTYDFLHSHDMLAAELSEDDILKRVDLSVLNSISK